MVTDSHKQFLAFVVTGGLAALVNVVARIGLSQFMSFSLAIIIAYLIAMTVAYILSRYFVFAASGRSVVEEFTKFAIVNGVAIVQVWLVTMGLHHYLLPAIGWGWYPELTAHFVGVASPVVTSYLGHKYFSFRGASVPIEDEGEN